MSITLHVKLLILELGFLKIDWKEGEGSSQRPHMSDLQTWTMVRGWTVGVGVGAW